MILSQRIVIWSGLWAFLSLTVLGLLGRLSIEYFFVLSLVGFLVILMLFGPFISRPGWRARASIVTLIGVLIFIVITLEKILTVLPIKLF